MYSHFFHILSGKQYKYEGAAKSNGIEQQAKAVESSACYEYQMKKLWSRSVQGYLKQPECSQPNNSNIPDSRILLIRILAEHHHHSPDGRYYNCIHNLIYSC